jgi:hypothetical protein
LPDSVDPAQIKACVRDYGTDADILARKIVELEAKPKSEDLEEAAEDKAAVEAKRTKLAKEGYRLETFPNDRNSGWGVILCSETSDTSIGFPMSPIATTPRTLVRSRLTRRGSGPSSRATSST